jgi:hypothetical protein
MVDISFEECILNYTCSCGNALTITLNLPKDIVIEGKITIGNVYCPACEKEVELPGGKHYVKGNQLLSE